MVATALDLLPIVQALFAKSAWIAENRPMTTGIWPQLTPSEP
jgi:hypothetical protein